MRSIVSLFHQFTSQTSAFTQLFGSQAKEGESKPQLGQKRKQREPFLEKQKKRTTFDENLSLEEDGSQESALKRQKRQKRGIKPW